MKTTFTFSSDLWQRILARWKSETGWKAWVKAETLEVLNAGTYKDKY